MLKKTWNLLLGMFTVFKHLFKRPVTFEYPEKRRPQPEKFRGMPVMKGCIKCGTCIKVCPSGAIKINNNEFIFDLKKCIFCGNCSFYCPKSAINMSDRYELATCNDSDLKLKYEIGEDRAFD